MVLEHVWSNSVTAKNGLLTRGAISHFNGFNLMLSPTSIDKWLTDDAHTVWYRNNQEELVAKAKMLKTGTGTHPLECITFHVDYLQR